MSRPPPFRRVLVANRGEIAVRVARGLAELGIEPVAVYSDADVQAAHVLAMPRAVRLGPAPARESYLDLDKVIAAAKDTGCEAIHPGYGFLSENPELPRAAKAAGLTFIGPTAEAMAALGSKQKAKEVAAAAGVPTVPGFHRDTGDDALLLREAERIGFPLLIKASAGGGGRGMRLVEQRAEFAEALAGARREALASFGDATMLLEKRVFPARHVEIQILGDVRGNAVSLHERECSVQRRHQKVLEEAPSPAVNAKLRAQMGEAAVALAKAAGYHNAGTVEFLLDEAGHYYFLEVNARLQVEHPVTELVSGLDLVHLQVLLAAGASLDELLAEPRSRGDLAPRGWAIEARICAENPEQGHLPAAGTLRRVREPRGPGIRVDSGVYEGCEVPVHYDSLLAKVVVHAPDRESACRRLAGALAGTVYLGIPTNVDFLHRIVTSEAFRSGRLSTDFLERQPELVTATGEPPDEVLVAALFDSLLRAGGGGTAPGRETAAAPMQIAEGFRLFAGDR